MAQILLVEDDLELQRVLATSLTRLGHAVTVADDGKQALHLLRTAVVDLVLTDLVMPEVEGIQLLRELKGQPNAPKVIAMSGGGRGGATDYLNMAMLLGAAATLEKPFEQKDLAAAIALVLGTA